MYSGREFIGLLKGLALKKIEGAEQIRTGAVSPTALAIPRMTACARPGPAVGMTTRNIVRHCEAPRARLASRRPPGTTRRATSEARAMIGSIITLRAAA